MGKKNIMKVKVFWSFIHVIHLKQIGHICGRKVL